MKVGVTTTWLEVNDVNGILPMVQHCLSVGLVDISVVLSLSYAEFVYNYDFDMIWIGCQSMFMKQRRNRAWIQTWCGSSRSKSAGRFKIVTRTKLTKPAKSTMPTVSTLYLNM